MTGVTGVTDVPGPELFGAYASRLGLKPALLHELAGEDAWPPWRVAAVERGHCAVLGLERDGSALVERRARHVDQSVTVGDWVLLDDAAADLPRVTRILSRTTWLERGSAHEEGRAQAIAANLDTVFIVAAFAETEKLERRSLRARRLDRFIAAVKEGGAVPVVVLNKADLAGRGEEELDALRGELSARLGGVEIVCVGARPAWRLGLLSRWLGAGETVAFIGSSGVGKSSLINALSGRELQSVGPLRERDAKGRHTTTRRELVALESGALLIDTPGVREFAVLASGGIAGFEDIDELAQGCRFTDCEHGTEPGCEVIAAVAGGRLLAERLESYRDLERDARRLATRHDAYARHLERAEGRRFGRLVRRAVADKKSRR